ncbi:aspartic peptidase domain-containing protein [Mycena leptocephala]|nr:aspartic peptidase domain-containing protein [Mycena leptocephala]
MLFTGLVTSWTLFHCLCAAEPLHLPLLRTGAGPLTSKDFSSIANRTRARYGGAFQGATSRRSSTELGILNDKFQGADIYYYTTIGIGTPPQQFNMYLDTSAADLFVAGTPCTSAAGCPTDIALYDNTKSSTAVNKSTTTTSSIAFQVGSVTGFIFEDTITMGSFVVLHANFLDATQSNILSSPISGLLGLGLTPPVATTTAIWQSAIANGAPEFSFWLARSNQSGVHGGAFTFGGTNTSLYTGDIEYLDVRLTSFTYWALNISEITVQGSPIIITGNSRLAAFEIGSTYIAGPSADVAAIWSQVPGSSVINDSSGFYQYPCTTSLNITVSFGGRTWPILPEDMNIGPISSGSALCRGAIYALSINGPAWLFGDTWMRNVYSVFRQTPPAMGFAQLSAAAGGPGAIRSPRASHILTGYFFFKNILQRHPRQRQLQRQVPVHPLHLALSSSQNLMLAPSQAAWSGVSWLSAYLQAFSSSFVAAAVGRVLSKPRIQRLLRAPPRNRCRSS